MAMAKTASVNMPIRSWVSPGGTVVASGDSAAVIGLLGAGSAFAANGRIVANARTCARPLTRRTTSHMA
ncbi:hypothetical protein GCM10023194_21630 [Planotetraspora phitsanulokensis]